MAPRIQGLDDSITFSGDLAVKGAVETYLYNITVAWNNVTAGDGVVLRNGQDNSGQFRVPIIFPTSNGTIQLSWPQGKYFPLGLFIDTNGNGQVQGEITYK